MIKTTNKDVQGSGKATFPGEKNITDESPRMEDEEGMDSDDQRAALNF